MQFFFGSTPILSPKLPARTSRSVPAGNQLSYLAMVIFAAANIEFNFLFINIRGLKLLSFFYFLIRWKYIYWAHKDDRMSDKIKFEIEYVIQSSPQLLYQYLVTPSGLSEWFADNVNSRGEKYIFIWDGA